MDVEVRGEGRPLVYLHSAAGPGWSPFLAELAKSRAVHLPRFPGFGGLPLDGKIVGRKGLAAAVAGYIEKNIGKPCDVMGCSFGGGVALWLAAEQPQWVDHLVLAAASGVHPIAQKYFDRMDAPGRAALEHYEAGGGEDAGLRERLAAIDKATLILHGTRDRMVVEAAAQRLKAGLKRAFLVYVWDAGHDLEKDQPQRMLGPVREFLERSDSFIVKQG